ncbi:hypothetical protein Lalb_Chr06g0170481 [Lupinus albus]|uniref:Uncharacterized protein n=1 Tax=Lupinus albus TaxID=3870 RepID=A0A6A4QD52_LUPAL|nr:hypothetical protein Lalb_Chr06g0170481 [Lupinus albus]
MLMSRLVTGMIQGDIGEKYEINIAVMLIFCSSWYYIFCCCHAIQDNIVLTSHALQNHYPSLKLLQVFTHDTLKFLNLMQNMLI